MLNPEALGEMERLADAWYLGGWNHSGREGLRGLIREAMEFAYRDAARWSIDDGWVGQDYAKRYLEAIDRRAGTTP